MISCNALQAQTILLVLFILGAAPANSVFDAEDWDAPVAEILHYSVKKPYLDRVFHFPARIVTERYFFSPETRELSRTPRAGRKIEVIRCAKHYSFDAQHYPKHFTSAVVMQRETPHLLVRQDETVLDWSRQSRRHLEAYDQMPVLEILEDGRTKGGKQILEKAPVVSEAMLFPLVRSLQMGQPHEREIWLLVGLGGDLPKPEIQWAKIVLDPLPRRIRDQLCFHAKVTREDEEVYEFWISGDGLHPIHQVLFPDGTQWRLESIARQRYWEW